MADSESAPRLNTALTSKRPMTARGRRTRPSLTFPVSLVALLLLWHLVVVGFRVPLYILPTPGATLVALWNGLTANPLTAGSLLFHVGITLRGAALGFIVGGTTGVLLGVLIGESKALERILMPYAVGLQSVPKIAIAPLVMIWFGYGLPSTVVLTALLTFFPLLINTYSGLNMVEWDYLLLMQGLRASRWQTLWWVKVPSALPMIFAGIDLGIVYSLLGAVVA
ncbi:MAG: ABC transporter permease, partial [Coriobacteriia bacterium]